MPEGTGAIFTGSEKHEDGEFVTVQEEDVIVDHNNALYFVTPPLPGEKALGAVEERRMLTRLPLLAIFHGVSHERGVPPSFSGTRTRPSFYPLLTRSRAQASCGNGRRCRHSACS